MRIAVVSDVHGNLTALDAVDADIEKQGVDLVVQGGDLVGGSRNAEVIDRVRERGWPGVYGVGSTGITSPRARPLSAA